MTVEERLAKLEFEVARARRLFRLMLVVVVVVVIGAVLAVAEVGRANAPKEIRANAFILEDSNGKVIASLKKGENGGTEFLLADNKGRKRVYMIASSTASAISIFTGNDWAAINLAILGDVAFLQMKDPTKKTAYGLWLNSTSTSSYIEAMNDKGNQKYFGFSNQ